MPHRWLFWNFAVSVTSTWLLWQTGLCQVNSWCYFRHLGCLTWVPLRASAWMWVLLNGWLRLQEGSKRQFGFYLFRSGITDCSSFLTSLGAALNCKAVKSHMLQVISFFVLQDTIYNAFMAYISRAFLPWNTMSLFLPCRVAGFIYHNASMSLCRHIFFINSWYFGYSNQQKLSKISWAH